MPTKEEIENINVYLSDIDYAVIVDNSDENNEELVTSTIQKKNKIFYYSEQTNLGLCKGMNIGVRLLEEKDCDWALLFDADSKPCSNIVSVYKKAIEKYKGNDVAVFTPVHVFERSKNKPYHGYKNVNWSMTSGWCINVDIFKKQNGFFEELFVDGLDMDYCFKSNENGHEIIECGEAIIKHHPAETKSFLKIKYGVASPYRYYMQARQLVWCWKRYHRLELLFIYMYKWFKVLILFPMKREYIRNMIQGTRAGVSLLRSYKANGK